MNNGFVQLVNAMEIETDKLNVQTISHERRHHQRLRDTKTLLTYTKGFLIAAYIVFIGGTGITLNELIKFLLDYESTGWLTAITLLILGAISFVGLWGAFKEDSCLLIVYGVIISIVFVLHVILLFYLKNACADIRKRCYRNLATPPGVAPILITISELAIAICAFFMALVIESEKKRQIEEPIHDLS
jgi:hypothetical protein